jgi:hypothetical protein
MSWSPTFNRIIIRSDPKYDDEACIDQIAVYRDLSVMDWFSEKVMTEVMYQAFDIWGYMHKILYNEDNDTFKVVYKQDETNVDFTVVITRPFFDLSAHYPDTESEEQDEVVTYQGVYVDKNPMDCEGYVLIFKTTN